MARKKPAKKPTKSKRGGRRRSSGRPREWSDAEMIAALKLEYGLVYMAADRLGCSAMAIYERAKSTPAVKDAMRHARRKVLDKAEHNVFHSVVEMENIKDSEWFLEHKGKNRGYVKRTESRIGGDKNAPPIQTQQGGFTLDHFNQMTPESRRAFLDALPAEVRDEMLRLSAPPEPEGATELPGEDDNPSVETGPQPQQEE